jgi:UDP-N-acetylmuramoylalanine--D-glutamate ligase
LREAVKDVAPVLDRFEDIPWSTLDGCLVSPGIRGLYRPHPAVLAARAQGCPCHLDLPLVYRELASVEWIGVTGTNGKSTTVSLLAHCLGRIRGPASVALAGNIGTPFFRIPRDPMPETVVAEMSSYMLEWSPPTPFSVAVFLNIEAHHLERYPSIAEYLATKARIFEGQGSLDHAILGVDDPLMRELYGSQRLRHPGTVWAISAQGDPDLGIGCTEAGVCCTIPEHEGVFAWPSNWPEGLSFRHAHHRQNVAAVLAALLALGVSIPRALDACASFQGLPHRLERLGAVGGVAIINDSKATNAKAAATALSTLTGSVFWLAGGVEEAGGFEALRPALRRITGAFLFGQSAETLARLCREEGCPPRVFGTLDEAAQAAWDAAMIEKAGTLILSPACASQDQYRSFEHRGDCFRAWIVAKAKKENVT